MNTEDLLVAISEFLERNDQLMVTEGDGNTLVIQSREDDDWKLVVEVREA